MAYTTHLLLWSLAALCAVTAYWGPDLPPGPYCGLRADGCCKERQDRCSHRILDTLCYCDEFCNHTASHDDCCPDYAEVCLGILPDEPIEPGFLIQPCKYAGQLFPPGQKRTDECNVCECILLSDNVTTQWQCERDVCVNSNEVIQGVNQGPSGWRAYNYTQFQGKKLSDAIVYKLGTLPLDAETKRMGPMIYEKAISYPTSFDARSKWPGYVSPVMDQGWCGSDWAVSLAGIVSDRLAIQSNGAEKSILSPQVLLSCNSRQLGCKGGHVDVAWNFARSHGLVEEHCLPYKATVSSCPYRPRGTLADDGCTPGNPLRTSRYKVGPPGRLRSEMDIMYDIMESGPVQAIMSVHQDFFSYRDGVYRHTRHENNHLQGLHSVRIVGWGEDRGEKYWLVANSWGPEWGENGYFRIARGENESEIESFVVTVLVDVTEALQG